MNKSESEKKEKKKEKKERKHEPSIFKISTAILVVLYFSVKIPKHSLKLHNI